MQCPHCEANWDLTGADLGVAPAVILRDHVEFDCTRLTRGVLRNIRLGALARAA